MDGRLKDAKLEAERAYHQRRANSLRQLGLCVRCGKPNSEPRYATCPECRARQRKRMKVRAFRDAMQTVHPRAESRLEASAPPARDCNFCPWARHEAGVIFCLLAAGTCAKRGTMLDGGSAGPGAD